MNYGFVRVGVAVPSMKVANCEYNASKINELIDLAELENIQIITFPELSVTGYTCGDLFHQRQLLDNAMVELEGIVSYTKQKKIVVIVGAPLRLNNQLFNCAVVISKGRVLGIVPKTNIPNYSEFYEKRWFSSSLKAKSKYINIFEEEVPFGTDLIFESSNLKDFAFGIELCEDLWVPIPPSSRHSVEGAVITFNLSASNEVIGKHEYRRELIKQQSGKCISGYVYASSGINESSTDVVFGGFGAISEYGGILKETKRFCFENQLIFADVDVFRLLSERYKSSCFMESANENCFRKIPFELESITIEKLQRYIDPFPFVPSDNNKRDERCSEIFSIQTSGLAKRFMHTKSKTAVIGISGGLDSTLALLVTVQAFDMLAISRDKIIAVTMPGFGTTDMTYKNAIEFMKSMGVTIKEINIKEACLQHFKDIGHDSSVHDVTYENVQARERTQILMDLANKHGGLVVGTGDLSELALGWCTYNGDHMSMYAVNTSIPKTLVKFLVKFVADFKVNSNTKDILYSIMGTPISPELLPPDENGEINQKTENIVGPYELHDFFMYHMLRYGAEPNKILFLANQAFDEKYDIEIIKKWLIVFIKRFFSQQFKRSCLPDGPKVGTISLSPRGDFRMPCDADADGWIKGLEG